MQRSARRLGLPCCQQWLCSQERLVARPHFTHASTAPLPGAAPARYTQAEHDAGVAAAVAAAEAAVRDAARADAMRTILEHWQHPALASLATGDPTRDRALSFLVHMLAPMWQLAPKCAALERALHERTAEHGTAGPLYRARVNALLTALLPEGVPGVVGPSVDALTDTAAYAAAVAEGREAQRFVRPELMAAAADLRARMWASDADAVQFAMTAGLSDARGPPPPP